MEQYRPDAKSKFARMTLGMRKEEFEKKYGRALHISDLMKDVSKDEPT